MASKMSGVRRVSVPLAMLLIAGVAVGENPPRKTVAAGVTAPRVASPGDPARAMSPPAAMDAQSINQQLLQMYQQRARMGQPAQPLTAPPLGCLDGGVLRPEKAFPEPA